LSHRRGLSLSIVTSSQNKNLHGLKLPKPGKGPSGSSGGTLGVSTSNTVMPFSSCMDMFEDVNGESPWFDEDGLPYNCAWYASPPETGEEPNCASYGAAYGNCGTDGDGDGALDWTLPSGACATANAVCCGCGGGVATPQDGTQIRFSEKISFENPSPPLEVLISNFFPLSEDDYPMSQGLANVLKSSNCVSVMSPNDYECSQSVAEMVELVGGIPTHAPQREFWPLFREVVSYQIQRRDYGHMNATDVMRWLNLPELWQDFTVNQVGEAVHDEVCTCYVIQHFDFSCVDLC
jgi:hypothetical protein